jgi:ketosteroid isomerase-like protein
MALGRCRRFFWSQSLGVYRPNISEQEQGDRMDQKEQILSTVNQMVAAFHEGDIIGILKTYEPGAVVVAEPGAPVTGKSALEAMFAGFIAAGARFTFLGHEVVQAGDLAVHFTPWRMTGTGGGLSVAVLRRQPDGKWLMVIDDPYGDSVMNVATKSQAI